MRCIRNTRYFPFWEEYNVHDKEPQTGKKTVTADDLKRGMYFRYTPDGSLRQLIKGSSPDIYYVICPTDGSRGNEGSLFSLAGSFGDYGFYELLDEQPVLTFLPKATPAPVPFSNPIRQFDVYADFAATFGEIGAKPKGFTITVDEEARETELQFADGTVVTVRRS